MEELALHPTVKPAALVADAMKDCSRRGDIVLDWVIETKDTLNSSNNSTSLAKSERAGEAIDFIDHNDCRP